MLDEIFNKIYKNKRYVSIMNEALGDGASSIDKIEEIYQSIIKDLKTYIEYDKTLMMAINSSRFVFYKCLDMHTAIRDNEDEILIRQYAKTSYENNGIKIDSDDDMSLHCYRKSTKGNYIQIYPFERFIIDTVNFNYFHDNAIFYKYASTKASKDQINQINSTYYIRSYDWNTIDNMLSDFKYKYIETIASNQEIKKSSKLIYTPTNVTKDTNSTDDNKITLAGSNKGDSITFRLYTSQLVADERPRTAENNTQMIVNSCTKTKAKLESESPDIIRSALYFKTDEDNGNGVKSSKANSIMHNNTSEQNRQIIQNAIKIINIYEDAVKQANNGEFNNDYKDSGNFNKDLQVYLPEILTPYALIHNACSWTSMGGKSGYKILQTIVKSSGDSFTDVPCYIGYYKSPINKLSDSFVWINGKFIDISTKAGLDGKGASASIASLRKYIYKQSENGQTLTNELTPKGESIKQYFPVEFEIFDLLSSKSSATPEEVYEILKNHNVWIGDKPKKNKSGNIGNSINKFLKQFTNFTGLIIEILQSASYDIIQMNCTPTSNGEDFHFTYKCQYPAIFEGNVDIHFTNSGFTKFHIV